MRRQSSSTCFAVRPIGIAILLAVFGISTQLAAAQVSVLTQHNDNSRTGQNLNETYLAPSNVKAGQFGTLFTQPLDGMAVAEPLYVPNLQINGATHNVVFVVTLHDGIYAFDADSKTGTNASPLWYTSLLDPPSVTTVPIAVQGCQMTGFTEMGILGTPVIDPTTNTMYLVAKTLESGNYVFRLHALNILTGQDSPAGGIVIQASYLDNGQNVAFAQQHRMQRPGLLLYNGVIYIAFGTMGCKDEPASTGWVMAYNESSLAQLAVLDVGPTQSSIPGIWMSGDGPSVDSNGNIYLATGDGEFDYNVGGLDFGDTLMKLNLEDGVFNLVDYFTPYDQANLDEEDLDLGASTLLLLPPQAGPNPNLGVITGKSGVVYLVNTDDLGEYNAVADQVVQEIPLRANAGVHVLGGAVYWNQFVYFGGLGMPIQQYSLTNGLLSTTPVAETKQSYNVPSLFSISANGNENGILWAEEQIFGASGDTGSVVGALNASNLAPLFTSIIPPAANAVAPGTSLNFPMVANGKVYVGTQVNLTVLGLYSKMNDVSGNSQTGQVGTTLPKPLRVAVTNAYTGSPEVGITVNFSDNGSGGTFGSPSAITNSSGVASTSYELPSEAGVYKITVTGTLLTAASFTETATPADNSQH